jgi:hypothetical protein
MYVLEYLPDLDDDLSQAEKHPGWFVLGWLAWYECTKCGYRLFAPVSVETVRSWGSGGWERMA